MVHGVDIVEELKVDHREVEVLFEQIQEFPRADARRKHRADDLTIVLVRHAVAEEEHLYPAVREFVPEGDALAETEITDHRRVEEILKDLEHWQAHEPEFDNLIARLRTDVAAHVRDEEDRLFPLLRDACTAEVLQDLGDKARRAKKTAPTRPHPSLPDTPPANKLLAPAIGLVDRLRDLLSGRGHQV